MYKILLIDDKLQVRISLASRLNNEFNEADEKSIEVYPCRNIYEAIDTWEEKAEELDALIVDMMMPSLGLDENLRPKTKAGLLTGWFLLWNAFNPSNDSRHPASDKCVIIYSAYLDDYKTYILNQASEAEKSFAKSENVTLIAKGASDSEGKLLECISRGMAEKEHFSS